MLYNIMAMRNIVEFKNVKYHYDEDTYAVKDVSFGIEEGSYTTIIGHNGSGKSTIAKLIIGLLEKESGDILIDGLDLNLENLNEIRTKVGIVFQNPDNQFIGSTVRDDIAFGLENHEVPHEDMDGIIYEFAKKVNMLDFLDHEPTKLSGGQKQRVAIAGVLAMQPKIIIFDESTSMLDPVGKREINQVIHELHNEHNITIISITHDIEEVSKSDYVLVMDNGHLAMQGTPKEVLNDEKKLVSLQLDLPFTTKMANELNKVGIKVDTHLDMEGLVEEICQSVLKK